MLVTRIKDEARKWVDEQKPGCKTTEVAGSDVEGWVMF